MSETKWTAESILALPTGGGFGQEHRMIDGVLRRVPVPDNLQAVWVGPDDVCQCVDSDGQAWRLGQRASGEYVKVRTGPRMMRSILMDADA